MSDAKSRVIDPARTREIVEGCWYDSIIPTLHDYIRIPALSPAFDADWAEHGHIDAAVALAESWVRDRQVPNSKLEVLRIDGRTPVLMLEVEGQVPGTVLLYGHLDKQPPFEGWRTEEGLGPWTPVIQGDRLYGRGGADDGYAIFGSVSAIEALQAQGAPHPRLVVLIECSEESGSPDLPAYIEAYAERIGQPELVVCLDSGAGDYERLWLTTSLRGIVVGDLTIEVLREGVHSGDASGVVPSSFRVIRMLLDRLEDAQSGRLIPEGLHVEIPEQRLQQAKQAAAVLGEAAYRSYPFVPGMRTTTEDPTEAILNRTWRPSLSYTGQAGLPILEEGGNVLRPSTSIRLSMRVPPTLKADVFAQRVRELLTTDVPYGAKVHFVAEHNGDGWQAPPSEAWLDEAISRASEDYFGQPSCACGEGGSIPFMGMLGEKFPQASFMITGVLGPESNAHGPNEFLHLPTGKRLSCAVAQVIAELGARKA